MQFLFLALIHNLHLSAVIRSLKGYHTVLYRDPKKILSLYKEDLNKDLLDELKSVLHNKNPSKFQGYATTKQRSNNRAYSNHYSIAKNMKKVEKTINKEDRNKVISIFPCWLERFLPHKHLTLQDLLIKLRKKDKLVIDYAYFVSLFVLMTLPVYKMK